MAAAFVLLAAACGTSATAGKDVLPATPGADAVPGAGAPSSDASSRADGNASLAALLCEWKVHPGSPLIEPPEPETLLGDPTVVGPEESPDGSWHLFANTLMGIHHFTSADGLSWERLDKRVGGIGAMRPFIIKEGPSYYLFYEKFEGLDRSTIQVVESHDLTDFGEPATVLEPTLPWEREPQHTVGNPYVTRRDGTFWLYYSASGVDLPDCGFREPLHIGVATAPEISGPYEKRPEPILSPSKGLPFRNLGAGSIKLMDEEIGGRRIALTNGIYTDERGASRSAISVMASDDGVAWEDVCPAPVITPTDEGWMTALVYAFDTMRAGDEIRIYFNARDGWAVGTERIGLATLQLPVD